MKSADYAWCALGAGVLAWDLLCEEGSTLSEGVDDWLTHHPVLTRAAILVLAAHLANAIPPKVDIVHQGFIVLRSTKTSLVVHRTSRRSSLCP